MLAENDLRDVTYAEGHAGSGGKYASRDSYAPTELGKTTNLVFPGPRMQLRTQVVAESRVYELKDVFVVSLEYLEDDIVFVTHRTVPVHAYGRGLKEALAAFSEAFDLQWRSLVEAPEDSLTPGGLKRRHAMQAVVGSVVEKG
jgi:hypothetical protein